MRIIGHRGDRENFDDNTFGSFQSAFDLGADGFETDVWLKDNNDVYVTHYFNHDRSKTYPLLKEVLEKFAQKGKIQIEIKDSNPRICTEVKKLLNITNTSNFEITSSQHAMFCELQNHFSGENLGLIVKPYSISDDMRTEYVNNMLLNWLKLTGSKNLWLVDLNNKFWSKERVRIFHKNNIKIGHHLTSNSLEDYTLMVDWEVDTIISDKLSILKHRK